MADKLNTQKAIKHLQEKWGSRPCPMCQQQSWNVSENLFELREFQGGNLILGAGPIMPVFPVTCNNCGCTILVNAIVSKVVESSNPVTK